MLHHQKQDLEKIEELLSPKKIIFYKNKFSNEWFEAYKSELNQAKEIFIYLHFLEIFLRNKIAVEFGRDFGDWLVNTGGSLVLNFKEREKVNKVVLELNQSNKEINLDNIVSSLNFGFWTNLFHKSYNYLIWQRNKMVERVFPFFKPHQRDLKQIQKEMEVIRKLRNRIFHFENLQSWDFAEMRRLIDKFVYGVSGMEVKEILK